LKRTKPFLVLLLALAVAFGIQISALAASDIVVAATPEDGNSYRVTAALQAFEPTDDLWIGTLGKWKKSGGYVHAGGTFFDNGEAIHDDDIILTNGLVGAVLAAGTRNPWGYPAGSILDAGTVKRVNGKLAANRDTVWSVEFLVNGWDGWAPENSGQVVFDLTKYDFKTKAEAAGGIDAVKVTRKYVVGGHDLDVVTYYGIAPGADVVFMFDGLANNGAETGDLSNRFSLTNKGDDGGAMKGIGAKTAVGTYGMKTEDTAFSAWFTLPGQNISNKGNSFAWSRNGGSVGYMELRANHSFEAGEAVTYDAYLIISDKPDTAALSAFLNSYNAPSADPAFTVTGTIADAASLSGKSAVILERDGALYGWRLVEGEKFSFEVPAGDYEYKVYLESDGLARGEALAAPKSGGALSLAAGKAKDALTVNLADQGGNAVWGKVEVLGEYPAVRFTGDSVFQALEKGVVKTLVSDIKDFKATVFGQGYFFYSDVVPLGADNVKDGAANVTVDMKFSTPKGWYSTDVHHHSNKSDAFSSPAELVPSILAAGLKVGFISDHDFTVNNCETYDLIRNNYPDIVGFIPSVEVSASWAHFMIMPQTGDSYDYFLDPNKENRGISQFQPFPIIVRKAHELGATITANHPYYSYGLFYAHGKDAIPGGYVDGFDMIELNACSNDDESIKIFNDAAAFWTAYLAGGEHMGKKVEKAHYLVGASDTHDVLYPGVKNDKGSSSIYHTGKARTYAFIGDAAGDHKAIGLAVANAMRDGHSYLSYGPILNPAKIFGQKFTAENGAFEIAIDIQSLNGVKDVIVLSNLGSDKYTYNEENSGDTKLVLENVLAVQSFNGENSLSFNYTAQLGEAENAWFAIKVVDGSEHQMFAFSNPYWVSK
jgi:hypothetical protein